MSSRSPHPFHIHIRALHSSICLFNPPTAVYQAHYSRHPFLTYAVQASPVINPNVRWLQHCGVLPFLPAGLPCKASAPRPQSTPPPQWARRGSCTSREPWSRASSWSSKAWLQSCRSGTRGESKHFTLARRNKVSRSMNSLEQASLTCGETLPSFNLALTSTPVTCPPQQYQAIPYDTSV